MSDFFDGPVVCNTGPIIGLSRAGLCDLLGKLFSEIVIPKAVVEELIGKEAGDAGEIAKAVACATVRDAAEENDPLLLSELDHGEAAVIQTARRTGISNVLMDERKGRRVAELVYGLRVKGSAAILLEASRRGFLAAVKPAIEAMRTGGYFLGPKLVAECLRRAGEE